MKARCRPDMEQRRSLASQLSEIQTTRLAAARCGG